MLFPVRQCGKILHLSQKKRRRAERVIRSMPFVRRSRAVQVTTSRIYHNTNSETVPVEIFFLIHSRITAAHTIKIEEPNHFTSNKESNVSYTCSIQEFPQSVLDLCDVYHTHVPLGHLLITTKHKYNIKIKYRIYRHLQAQRLRKRQVWQTQE